jgi:hypothetical protein
MSNQDDEDGQTERRMDALLLKLLKTPPQSRVELAEQVRRDKGKKATRPRRKRPGAGKRGAAV